MGRNHLANDIKLPVDRPGRVRAVAERTEAGFRLIDHPPEGHTERASRLRRHPLAQAAKCIVVRVARGRRSRRYVLAVVPGDRRVKPPRAGGRGRDGPTHHRRPGPHRGLGADQQDR
ncbi:hypothetical protein GCM10010365_23280 [Streptomyces poonensis]|uniref:Uncharacterized protein n=1 Tax=Streptomyces poonensis TaxID=68255 RepID=A0A918UG92_9ACTN|nr:hypothetical protein GCM10010365_23280 [Streptomyces poonensis]GLJ90767.1 hypothetical protein GCM10017589_33720 [Streptomyces poonensis]